MLKTLSSWKAASPLLAGNFSRSILESLMVLEANSSSFRKKTENISNRVTGCFTSPGTLYTLISGHIQVEKYSTCFKNNTIILHAGNLA